MNYLKFGLIILTIIACSQKQDPNQQISQENNAEKTISEIVSDRSDLSILDKALKTTGLDSLLNGEDPYTLFAPSNKGFETLPEGTLEELMVDSSRFTGALEVHLTKGSSTYKDLKTGQDIPSVEGVVIPIRSKNGKKTVNQGYITTADIQATNGVIHIVDRFLVHMRPPD